MKNKPPRYPSTVLRATCQIKNKLTVAGNRLAAGKRLAEDKRLAAGKRLVDPRVQVWDQVLVVVDAVVDAVVVAVAVVVDRLVAYQWRPRERNHEAEVATNEKKHNSQFRGDL